MCTPTVNPLQQSPVTNTYSITSDNTNSPPCGRPSSFYLVRKLPNKHAPAPYMSSSCCHALSFSLQPNHINGFSGSQSTVGIKAGIFIIFMDKFFNRTDACSPLQRSLGTDAVFKLRMPKHRLNQSIYPPAAAASFSPPYKSKIPPSSAERAARIYLLSSSGSTFLRFVVAPSSRGHSR